MLNDSALELHAQGKKPASANAQGAVEMQTPFHAAFSVRAIEPEENRSILKLSRVAASLGADSASDARNAYKHLQACQDEMAVLSGDVRRVLFEEGNVPGSVLV